MGFFRFGRPYFDLLKHCRNVEPIKSFLPLVLVGSTALSLTVTAQEFPKQPATPPVAEAAKPADTSPVAEQPVAEQPAAEQPLAGKPKFAFPVEGEPFFTPELPEKKAKGDGRLQFSFDGARWREVIQWLADQNDLALFVDDLPTGSFTYSDPNFFTHQQAMDRVNLFLLPQGYTLVRSGDLLSVINLGDPRSVQQLNSLAKLVKVDELQTLENHEVVKCFFPLGELSVEDALEELSALNLMTTPASFERTNQLLITDTAGSLKNVQTIIEAFKPSTLDNGTIVKSFALRHVDAEDILMVARPHLGLATGEMIGIDVSLSADLQGKNIFVTGIEDKVKLIEGLISEIDKPSLEAEAVGAAELRTHLVSGGNTEVVYNVLQTLLAGKTVRMSMDEAAGTIVVLATVDIQNEIAQTVSQMQLDEAEFAVIPLKNIDPYFAISLLEEMLDLSDSTSSSINFEPWRREGRGWGQQPEVEKFVPKIDADPGSNRLFVLAKKSQLEQIRKIVTELDVSSISDGGGLQSDQKFRVFPLKGKQAELALETAAKFWREDNPILLFRSSSSLEPQSLERDLHAEPTQEINYTAQGADTNSLTARFLTDNIDSQAAVIRCQVTPRGLLLQSDDTKALDLLEESLRAIAGPGDSAPSPPIVFYLKYTRPNDALRTLAELLDGGEAAKEAEADTLVNGFVASSDYYLGSIVTTREGTMTLMAGTITVVADTRLNRLIAQGTESEIELIQDYLKIIDKETSITTIETFGTSHVIELRNIKATEAATIVREAYANRLVAGPNTARPPGQPGKGQPQDPRAAAAAKAEQNGDRGGEGRDEGQNGKKTQQQQKSSGSSNQGLEPKMSLAVHEPSNSLIVVAPEQLFREVESLVKLMDTRSAQTMRIISAKNSAGVDQMLQLMFPQGEISTSGGGFGGSFGGTISGGSYGSGRTSGSTKSSKGQPVGSNSKSSKSRDK